MAGVRNLMGIASMRKRAERSLPTTRPLAATMPNDGIRDGDDEGLFFFFSRRCLRISLAEILTELSVRPVLAHADRPQSGCSASRCG